MAQVQGVISNLNPKKSSYDIITHKIHKELPIIGLKYCLPERVLPCIMEGGTDHSHLEGRETS
jgi:hypothetical protein